MRQLKIQGFNPKAPMIAIKPFSIGKTQYKALDPIPKELMASMDPVRVGQMFRSRFIRNKTKEDVQLLKDRKEAEDAKKSASDDLINELT